MLLLFTLWLALSTCELDWRSADCPVALPAKTIKPTVRELPEWEI